MLCITAKNGENSILYENLYDQVANPEEIYKKAFSQDFLNYFGDWKSLESVSDAPSNLKDKLDKNGEPKIEYVLEYIGLNNQSKTTNILNKQHEIYNKDRKKFKGTTGLVSDVIAVDMDPSLYRFNEDNFIQGRLNDRFGRETLAQIIADIAQNNETQQVFEYKEYYKELKSQTERWPKVASLGDSLHDAARKIVEDDSISSYEDFVKKHGKAFFSNDTVGREFIDGVLDFINELRSKGTLLTEVPLYYNGANKVRGILDLIVVKPNGNIEIYDYKFSTKGIVDYDEQKDISIEYQMGLYRNMAKALGIQVDGVYIKSAEIVLKGDKLDAISYAPTSDFGNRPNLLSGTRMSEIIDSFIEPIDLGTSDLDTNNDAIIKIMDENFNFNVTNKTISPDQIFKKWVVINKTTQQYYIKTPYAKKKSVKIPDGIKDDRNAIKKYMVDNGILQQLQDFERNSVSHVSNYVRELKEYEREDSDTRPKFASDKDENETVYLALKKYKTNLWREVKNDSLKELGINGFQRVLDNGQVELDLVLVSDERLHQTYDVGGMGGKLLTGRRVKDNIVLQKDKETAIPLADYGNIHGLKAVLWIMNNREIFAKNIKIGNIQVISKSELSRSINLDNMKHMLSYMLKKEYINNEEFKKSLDIKHSLTDTERFISHLQEMIKDSNPHNINLNSTERKRREGFLSAYAEIVATTSDRAKKKEKLIKLLEDKFQKLRREKKGRKDENEFRLLAGAILELKNMSISLDKDIKAHGYFLDQSRKFSQPDEFQQKSISLVKQLTEASFLEIRKQYVDYKNNYRSVALNFMEAAGYSGLRRYTVGDSDTFLRKIVEFKNNNGEQVLRIKDPRTIENEPERKLAEYFIKKFNDIRLQGADPEYAASFINSDAARNIPLMPASATTKMRDLLRGRDLNMAKVISKDLLESVNMNKAFTDDKDYTKSLAEKGFIYSSFKKYDSANETSLENRNEKLRSEDINEFEWNPEIILDNMVMESIREKEVNKILPTMQQLMVTLEYQQEVLNNKTEETRAFIEQYLEGAINNAPELSEEAKGPEKLLLKMTGITSKMLMGFSPSTGLTQLLQGIWGNVAEIVATRNKHNRFGFKSFAKAGKILLQESATNINQINRIDALNERYGIANLDLRVLEQRLRDRQGIYAFQSRWMFANNSIPDYFNRMMLLMSQMIEDGSYEAHTLNKETNQLEYNMYEDKRFEAYLKNDKSNEKLYNRQKALYDFMLSEFQETTDTANTLLYLEDGKVIFKEGYTPRQIQSFKSWADSIHGAYDQENKTQFAKTAFGKLVMQFKTWIRARILRYHREGIMHSSQGDVVYEPLEGGRVVARWEGRYMEGILQTLLHIGKEIKGEDGLNAKLKKAWSISGELNQEQKDNMRRLGADFGLFALLVMASGVIDDEIIKEDRNSFAATLNRSLRYSANDLLIFNTVNQFTSLKTPIASFGYLADAYETVSGVLTGQKDPMQIFKISGITKPIYYNYRYGQ